MSASASFEAVKRNGRIALSSAAAAEVLPEVAGDGLCAGESEVTPRAAMIIGSVIFMTAFLVELKEARPETRSPCQGEPRSLGFASILVQRKTKNPTLASQDRHLRPRPLYPDEHAVRGRRRVDCIGRMVMRPSDLEIASQSHLKIFKSLLRSS